MEETGAPLHDNSCFDTIEFDLSNSKEVEHIKSFFPTPLFELFQRQRVVLAGGAITSIFTSQPINDFDLFFPSQEALTATNVALKSVMNSLKGGYYRLICTSQNAITIQLGTDHKKPITVQLISTRFGDAEQIISSFDLTVCKGAFDFLSQNFIFSPTFFKDLAQKKLVYNHLYDHPIGALLRIEKYRKRGYTMDIKEVFKVGLSISRLNIKSGLDLMDALRGFYVDKTLKSWFNSSELVSILNLPSEEVTEFFSLYEKQKDQDRKNLLEATETVGDTIPF